MMAALASRNPIAVISATESIAVIGVLAFGAMLVVSWQGRAR
jgi:hypothetical protein